MAKGIIAGYLVLYNLIACFGWACVLVICIQHIIDGSIDSLWKDVELALKVSQTMALMEVLHSMIGFVKSPWMTTLMQVFSRIWTLWFIMNIAPPAQTSIFTVLACTSWGLVEVPRYLFYALNLLNAVPYPLFWLRYSLFAILYPTGITGELGCMYEAAKYFVETQEYTLIPIASIPEFKIPFLYIIIAVALTYIPGSPKMYFYMVKTRAKQFKEYNRLVKAEKKP